MEKMEESKTLIQKRTCRFREGREMQGKIVRLLVGKGFGFIRGEDNREYFFHRSVLKNARIEEVRVAQDVTFEEDEGDKGLRAADVYAE